MSRIPIKTIGTIKIEMDKKDDVYFDAKDPHVCFVRNGRDVVPHCYLSEVDNLVATGDSDMQEAIRYLRKNKDELIKQYIDNNR